MRGCVLHMYHPHMDFVGSWSHWDGGWFPVCPLASSIRYEVQPFTWPRAIMDKYFHLQLNAENANEANVHAVR